MGYKIRWADEAIRNLDDTLQYLESEFTQKEVDSFKAKLKSLINLISQTPALFPVSIHNSRFRKSVLSKQTTVYYEVKDDQVILALIFNSKRDPKNIS